MPRDGTLRSAWSWQPRHGQTLSERARLPRQQRAVDVVERQPEERNGRTRQMPLADHRDEVTFTCVIPGPTR